VFDGHGGDSVAKGVQAGLGFQMALLSYPYKDQDLLNACEIIAKDVATMEDAAGTGTAAMVALVDHIKDEYHITTLHLGDSRALLVPSTGARMDLTVDHKPDNKVERERIIKAGGYVVGNRICGNLSMSRAFGDTALTKYGLSSTPEIGRFVAKKGDRLLIYCDGIVEKMGNETVAELVRIRNTPSAVCELLMDKSLEAGSRDNMSVICVEFGDFEDRPTVKQFLQHGSEPNIKKEPLDYCSAYRLFSKRYPDHAVVVPALEEEDRLMKATEKEKTAVDPNALTPPTDDADSTIKGKSKEKKKKKDKPTSGEKKRQSRKRRAPVVKDDAEDDRSIHTKKT